MVDKRSITVSIIIPRKTVTKELADCLDSIRNSQIKSTYETIVVDNDIENPVEKTILKKYKWVKYIKNSFDRGFGGSNNVGESYAKGEYLFFINSDTVVFKNTIDNLVNFMKNNSNAGVISPLLLDENKKAYQLQGARILNPLYGIICLSFVNKYFPNNPVSNHYFIKNRKKLSDVEVDVVPGTAMFIRKKLFNSVGRFDERYFLYFEEIDLCRRIRQRGYKNYIISNSKIVHLWARSTNADKKFYKEVFRESKFYYFKKNFGVFSAIIVWLFTDIHLNSTSR